MVAPPPKPRAISTAPEDDPLGLMRLMTVPESPPPIPIQFFPAPGTRVPEPGPRPLPSDANRVAKGGAPELPPMPVPDSKAEKGIQDLEKGSGETRPEAGGETSPPAQRVATRAQDRSPLAKAWWERPVGPAEPFPDQALPASSPEAHADVARKVAKPLAGVGKSPIAGLTAEEAARAAAQPGSEKGAGFEKPGGFVDNGPISFETA